LLVVENEPSKSIGVGALHQQLSVEISTLDYHLNVLKEKYLTVTKGSTVGVFIRQGFLHSNGVYEISGQNTDRRRVALTLEGHKFICDITDESTWSKIKDVATDKGVGLTFDVIALIITTLIASIMSSG